MEVSREDMEKRFEGQFEKILREIFDKKSLRDVEKALEIGLNVKEGISVRYLAIKEISPFVDLDELPMYLRVFGEYEKHLGPNTNVPLRDRLRNSLDIYDSIVSNVLMATTSEVMSEINFEYEEPMGETQ